MKAGSDLLADVLAVNLAREELGTKVASKATPRGLEQVAAPSAIRSRKGILALENDRLARTRGVLFRHRRAQRLARQLVYPRNAVGILILLDLVIDQNVGQLGVELESTRHQTPSLDRTGTCITRRENRVLHLLGAPGE